MSPETRWRRRPSLRRDELLDAAEGLLVERELSEVAIDEITQAAGVSKGTFYSYFSTKTDLYIAVNQRFIDGLMQAREARLARVGARSWLEQADALIEVSVKYLYDHEAFITVWCKEAYSADIPNVMTSTIERLASELERDIVTGTEAGEIVCHDPVVAARLIVHAIDQTVAHDLIYARGRARLGRRRVIAAAQRMVRGMLSG